MRLFRILFLFLCLNIFVISAAFSQGNQLSKTYKDKLILKTNQVLFGQLIYYSQDSVIWELKSGSQIKFLTSQVKNVFQFTPKENHREKSWHALALSNDLIFNKKVDGAENIYGVEISVLYKYFWHNGHVLAGGFGFASYNVDMPFLYLPVVIGYEYHLPLSFNNSVYFGFRSGYTFISYDDTFRSPDYQAGWLMNPTLGMLFKINSRFGLFAETGLKFQQANHSFDDRWWRISQTEQLNRRYLFRLGMIF